MTTKVNSYGWKALLGSAVGYAMDGFDLLILGFMLSAISADLGLTPAQGGSLVTWTLVGAVFGGIVFGALSDKYGRVRVLTWTIILFAIFTGLCALAQGYWDLLIYRTIAGIGLGGEFGIGMALAAEAWPARHRAKAASYVALGWQVGVLGAALLTPLLQPQIGWRGMFVVGIFPAFVAWYLRARLHEPEIFVQKQTALLQAMAKLDNVSVLKEGEQAPLAVAKLVGNTEILVPMAGFINKEAELARLTKEIEKYQNEVKRIESKLSNEAFVSKAPEAVIAKEREKQAEYQSGLEKICEQYKAIEAL